MSLYSSGTGVTRNVWWAYAVYFTSFVSVRVRPFKEVVDHRTNVRVVTASRNWRRTKNYGILWLHFNVTVVASTHPYKCRTWFTLTTRTDHYNLIVG